MAGLALLPGCSGQQPERADNRNASRTGVTILVAASLRECVAEMVRASGIDGQLQVDLSAASSSSLARQVIAGAPADLFFSASREWAEEVLKEIPSARGVHFADGRMVMIVPADAPHGPASLAELARDEKMRLGVGAAEVPAGRYAMEALGQMKLLEKLQDAGQLVYGQDVRQVLHWTGMGEIDAGIVYASDALLEKNVRIAQEIDPALHQPVEYWIVWLPGAGGREEVDRMYAFVQSPAAGEILARFGFGTVHR